jgi:hypothetical protein
MRPQFRILETHDPRRFLPQEQNPETKGWFYPTAQTFRSLEQARAFLYNYIFPPKNIIHPYP